MTGCEILGYKNGKIYLIKFRHDGSIFRTEYFKQININLNDDPIIFMQKIIDWFNNYFEYPDNYPEDNLNETNKRYVLVKDICWDRNTYDYINFFKLVYDEIDKLTFSDEMELGANYQIDYSDYQILIDFDNNQIIDFNVDEDIEDDNPVESLCNCNTSGFEIKFPNYK